ncbi:muts domain V-domain-containing protein [Pseudoneurospora amorphoporcata]|uniref:Muts domain V-domain-containing protein n=1 Tax=Pseudoneurospora amorphoporcata TaxID=241081 RepID=A0AAN6NWC1_9PEZI|nr:muts domain V-domain-containing protein [Pseudoneurospora amorphoporcata]
MLPPRPKQVPRLWIASLGQSSCCRPCVVNNIRTAAATVGRCRGAAVSVGRYATTQTSRTSAGPRLPSLLLAVPARPVVDITSSCPRLLQLQNRGKKTRTAVQLNDLPLPPVVESAVNGLLLVVEESVQDEGTPTTRRKRIKRTILQLDQLPESQTTLTADHEDTDSAKAKRGRRKTVQLDDLATSPDTVVEEPLLPVEGATEEAAEVEEDESSTKRKRGKTRTVRLKEIPQGALLPDESFPLPQQEDQGPAYPAVIQQHRHNMQKFDNCVLLTRVGGFYEMYFEHAEEIGPLLNLKVSQKKTNGGPVSMAGFPFFQLERHLKVLVQDLSRHVAIAEEYKNSPSEQIKSGGLMHNRRVSRIITPGTLIDENFMDPYANNYIMAMHLPTAKSDEGPSSQEALNSGEDQQNKESLIGLAWLDLSTGNFYTQQTSLVSLGSVLSRVSPREIVLDKALESAEGDNILSVLNEERYPLTYSPLGEDIQTLKDWAPMLDAKIPVETVLRFTDDEIKAGNVLLHYVRDRLQGLSMKLQPPIRHDNMEIMAIDKNSMRSLEIKQTIRDGRFAGSLLHAIRRTVTKSGARLLNEWLSAPSTSLTVINARLDLTTRFISNPDLSDAITVLLRRSHDTQRLVQKFALNRGNADDLLRLASTIKTTEDIFNHLKSTAISSPDENPAQEEDDDCLTKLLDRISLEQPLKLAKRIWDAIDEEGLVQQHQLEDSETGEMLALAQEIVKDEGTEEDERALLPKGVTARSNRARQTATATAATTTTDPNQNQNQKEREGKDNNNNNNYNKKHSLRNYYGEDTQVWIMKPKANRALAKLHAELESLLERKEKLTEEFRARYAAPTLTLMWKAGLGHVCVVRGRDARLAAAVGGTSRRTRTSSNSNSSSLSDPLDAVPEVVSDLIPDTADTDAEPVPEPAEPEPESLSTLRTLTATRTTRTFHHPLWTSLGESLDHVRLRIRSEETALFSSLRSNVVTLLIKLRRNALVLDELDIATSLARLATEQNLVRPVLHDSRENGKGTPKTVIVGGRHPTVEPSLLSRGMTFQKNDCLVGAPGQGRIWLITGPNMAGKSTFLRQNALITILAQMGCYVPADFAELGIVDAIFSRVGSADNLYADQSTFMVEMMETAAILRQATPRSFVIMDEIGRGTTPEDGTAVAFASLHHLLTVNKCRGLFATHFHAVGDMVRGQGLMVENGSSSANGGVAMYCTDVEEDESGGFVYVHKLRKGTNRQSHALKVARLAGLPEPAIKIAEQVLAAQGVVASESR